MTLVKVIVHTPFDTEAELKIGTLDVDDQFMKVQENDLKVADSYIALSPEIFESATFILGFFNANSASAGLAEVQITYA